MKVDVGSRVGPYEIAAEIGAGGMGVVYRARDTRLGRDVAIKISNERFSERPAMNSMTPGIIAIGSLPSFFSSVRRFQVDRRLTAL